MRKSSLLTKCLPLFHVCGCGYVCFQVSSEGGLLEEIERLRRDLSSAQEDYRRVNLDLKEAERGYVTYQ